VLSLGYCPKCGAKVYKEEIFCVNCGDRLPGDQDNRIPKNRWRVKYFTIPIILLIVIIGSSITIYTLFNIKVTDSEDLYIKAEEALLLTDYDSAKEHIEQAIDINPSFKQAEVLHQFTEFTVDTLNHLDGLDNEYEKIQMILEAKNELSHYTGEAVEQFKDLLSTKQTTIQLNLLNEKLAQNPSTEELPALLWEADSIQDPEAYELVRLIREQLVTHATNEAYAYLEQKQFRLAANTVKTSLQYSPNDSRLASLLNSIEKEKEAFEVAQEARLEQAFSQYEVEQERNENDAIDDLAIHFEVDQNEQLVISGELTSVATIPIHAILVHYTLLDEEANEIASNDIFIYPETLYPGETGEFERTYVDPDIVELIDDINVTSVTWLLD